MHNTAKSFNWRINRGKIVLADKIRVVPQRSFREDWNRHSSRPPRSYGIAPVGISAEGPIDDEIFIPIPETEISWLGLEPVNRQFATAVKLHLPATCLTDESNSTCVDAWVEDRDFVCPPAFAIKGKLVGDYWYAFGKSGQPADQTLERIMLTVNETGGETISAATITFVESAAFRELTGGVGICPLSRDSGYQDYPLP